MMPTDPISCRRFRAHHAAWVDLELERDASIAMERHVALCEPCSRHDTGVRRALLVVRNLPDLRPSADFHATLAARLVQERATRLATVSRHRPPTLRTVTALAASLVAMAWLAEHRPAAGLPEPEIATIAMPAEIPALTLPRAVVRSAPLRENAVVRVVSVQRSSEPEWTPGPPMQPSATFAPTLVSANYATTVTR